jgi:hypothetical protein
LRHSATSSLPAARACRRALGSRTSPNKCTTSRIFSYEKLGEVRAAAGLMQILCVSFDCDLCSFCRARLLDSLANTRCRQDRWIQQHLWTTSRYPIIQIPHRRHLPTRMPPQTMSARSQSILLAIHYHRALVYLRIHLTAHWTISMWSISTPSGTRFHQALVPPHIPPTPLPTTSAKPGATLFATHYR